MIDNHEELKYLNIYNDNKLIITFIIIMKSFFNNSFAFFFQIIFFTQSGKLLIQQYNKGPSLDNYYSKLEIYMGGDIFRINKNEKTKPLINFGGNIEVVFNLSSTFGIKSGMYYFPVKYYYKKTKPLKI